MMYDGRVVWRKDGLCKMEEALCGTRRSWVNNGRRNESIGRDNEWGAESELGGGQAAEFASDDDWFTFPKSMTRKR